jgi:hypothetical protein
MSSMTAGQCKQVYVRKRCNAAEPSARRLQRHVNIEKAGDASYAGVVRVIVT